MLHFHSCFYHKFCFKGEFKAILPEWRGSKPSLLHGVGGFFRSSAAFRAFMRVRRMRKWWSSADVLRDKFQAETDGRQTSASFMIFFCMQEWYQGNFRANVAITHTTLKKNYGSNDYQQENISALLFLLSLITHIWLSMPVTLKQDLSCTNVCWVQFNKTSDPPHYLDVKHNILILSRGSWGKKAPALVMSHQLRKEASNMKATHLQKQETHYAPTWWSLACHLLQYMNGSALKLFTHNRPILYILSLFLQYKLKKTHQFNQN